MAGVAFVPPKFVPTEKNVCAAWRSFKEELENYFIAADLSGVSGRRKVAILLYTMGSKYKDIFETFTFANADEKKNFNLVKEKFDNYFEPKKVTKLYMKQFDTCTQLETESVGEYVSRLRGIAQYCDFGTTLENQLCKQISVGVKYNELRDRLWADDLTLDQIINKCHLHEQRVQSKSILDPSTPTNVNSVQRPRQRLCK